MLMLIIGSGFFSGLTIALMSLEKGTLKKIISIGGKEGSSYTEEESIMALKVLETTQDKTKLIVTLLLGNTAVNAALSVYLSGMVGAGLMAGVISTVLIVLFGEIIPVVVITKYALRVGSFVAPFVKLLAKILYPISFSIIYILNRFIGEDELKQFSKLEVIHQVEEMVEDPNSKIDSMDVNIVRGALSLNETRVQDIMTPRNKVYRLDSKTIITKEKIEEIIESGYTRIPVFEDDNQEKLYGILNTKKLIGIDPIGLDIKDFVNKDKSFMFNINIKTDDAIARMISKKRHLAIISNNDFWEGIITLEDIMEAILNTEIEDEFDD